MYAVNEWMDIPYAPQWGLSLDMYVPQGEGPFPLLCFFFGGGLVGGCKEDLRHFARTFASAGVAVAAPTYRLFPLVGYPEFIWDAARAVAWLCTHAGERMPLGPLWVGGYSAGGFLSMTLSFDKRYLAAFGIDSDDDIHGYFHLSGQPTAHFNVLGSVGHDRRRIVVDETAPLYYARSHGARQVFIASDDDIPGRLEQNALFVATLRHFGYDAPLEMRVAHGYTHGQMLDYCEALENPLALFEG